MSVVVVTERDTQHMSHESQAMGKQAWDVHQNDQLVGVFPSEEEALAYQAEIQAAEQGKPFSDS